MESKQQSRRGFLKFLGLFGAAATVCGVTPLVSAPIQVAAPKLATGGLIKHTEDLIPVKLLDGECWIPELWAKESLKILEENMVIGNLVHRDFDSIALMNVGGMNTVVTTKYDEAAKGTLITLDLVPGNVRLHPDLKTVTLG